MYCAYASKYDICCLHDGHSVDIAKKILAHFRWSSEYILNTVFSLIGTWIVILCLQINQNFGAENRSFLTSLVKFH